jgi:hypothetical protein
MDANKACPFCGEQVLAVAIKCKHCGSNLNGAPSKDSVTVGSADLGWALLGIPIAGSMLLWFWVAQLSLIQGPGSATDLIIVAVVLGTAAVAAIEAGKLGMKADRAAGSYSPVQWAALIVLLWVIGFPAYLFKRRHYSKANLLVPGIVVSSAFVISAVLLLAAINAKVAEIQASLASVQNAAASLGTESASAGINNTSAAATKASSPMHEDPPPAVAPERDVAQIKIQAYCKGLVAGGGGYEIEETCRKLEFESWRHLAVDNEFANADATMLKQCATSPMNDSFQIEETCLKQEMKSRAAM